MVGVMLDDPVKLVDPEVLIGENIIDAKGGRESRESATYAEAFFQESILHVAFYREISIGIRHIIHVAAKNYRVRAIIQHIVYDVGLQAPAGDAPFHFRKYGS